MMAAVLVAASLANAPTPFTVGAHLDVLQFAAPGVSGGVSGRLGPLGLSLDFAHLTPRTGRLLLGDSYGADVERLTFGLLATARYFPFDGPLSPFLGVGLGAGLLQLRGRDGARVDATASLWRAEAGLQWSPFADADSWVRSLWLGASASVVFVGLADVPAAAPELAFHPSLMVGFWR